MTALPVAITLGDPAGIGPEIIARAFRDHGDTLRGCFVAGDVAAMRRAARLIEPAAEAVRIPVAALDAVDDVADVPPRTIPVLQVVPDPADDLPWGRVDARAGRVAADCVRWAARAALRGDIAALVTAPLHKEALAAAGVDFPGHTELLQAEAAAHVGCSVAEMPVRMMLANDELRTVLVSIHLSLRDAIDAIDAVTIPRVLQTLRIADAALARSLGRRPRIAVAGLNPHAGEGDLFGSEEVAIIAPAIAAALAEGIDTAGPFAPDTVFMRARNAPGHPGEYDAVVAMYHDQGLIPVKYLGVEQGVNVTLGLPLVRTSPDHGTAFDIAGRGVADPASLVAAAAMARRLAG
ncbi:4-hydroxythreonine-4-phosphate dehydrogenase PdxA [Xylophilus sp.]|uniref:4-hydroxythreonine-4-phosphate dehydrogenase PdxA n=1 Tax=Xylophilus sp. TaxID=2653893 RepID=UPI0013B811B5|nr:4-hydroxythreonine-4-phosphate dehydrogenase PdxA [Xylophilus sp.]KAF1044282.1 MAG: D-threonate 4-phosphate dehydrogenase [Xylophilus sp.]